MLSSLVKAAASLWKYDLLKIDIGIPLSVERNLGYPVGFVKPIIAKKFDESDFGAFLELLPRELDGKPLRHAVEVRHNTFKCAGFVALIRRHAVPVVYADHPTYPAIADLAGDFVYARLQKGEDTIPTAYPPKDIARWAEAARTWASGGVPTRVEADLCAPSPKGKKTKPLPLDVFVYFIHGGKVHAPAAAQAFTAALLT